MNDEEIPILHGPLTEEEKARLAEEERVKAEKATEAAYKKDQLELTKSSIRLTRANLRITWALVAFTAVGTVAAWVQACIGNRSMRASESAAIAAKSASDTAAQTLHEMQSGKGAQDTHTRPASRHASDPDHQPCERHPGTCLRVAEVSGHGTTCSRR